MEVFRRIADLRRSLAELKQGTTIGFVPTMGYFHEGHLSLLRTAAAENDVVVASIFVNPYQFGQVQDFDTYPRDLDRDGQLAESAGVSRLFVPEVEEIYPSGPPPTKIDPGRIGEVCEGQFRPGHFAAVATVCMKLFNIVGPDRAYFGEKDAQQLAVIRQVVRDLNVPIEIVGCPTQREPGGLALSSRNNRLSPNGLEAARVLSRALFSAARLAERGERSAHELCSIAKAQIAAEPRVSLQYVEVVDGTTFSAQEKATSDSVLALAAYVEGVRLIDNLKLGEVIQHRSAPDAL